MQKLFQEFHNGLKRVTEPNHKKYPDPMVRQYTWNRNIAGFYIAFSFLLFSTGLFFVPYLTFSIRLTILIINICVPIVLVLLCRSYMWLFAALYATMVLIYTSQAFDNFPDAPYVYVGYIHVVIACSLLYGGDLKVVLCSGVCHMVLCLTKFRAKLLVLVQEEDPQVFADKFAGMVGFFIILKLLIDISLVSTLDRRTIELLRAKKSLEAALEQQKTFIFSFSHELRNPINSLLGNLQLVLQGEVLTAKAAEMINIAKVCGEILLHNINNMLDTGKHEIGKLEVNPISTQLQELFQRTWSIYSELLSRKKLRGQLRIAKDMPAVVKIDSQKINQILLNLIGNSIKFTEKGSVTVTVKWLKYGTVNDKCFEPIPYDETDEGLFEKEENITAVSISHFSDSMPGFTGLSHERRRMSETSENICPLQESKGVLKIIVKDTGSGMKKEALEKLFKKFSQVSEDATQRQIGTGLGLFITKEICTIMKGEIRAYSQAGVGSTFIVCIPTISVPLDNVQRMGSELILNHLKEKQLKALVADDSPFNVNLTCNYFTQFGGSVVAVAYNGFDAFRKYKEASLSNIQIDLVTLDIDMPVMDGRKACDKIRQFERENRLKPTVIILISGNYDSEQIDEYINPEQGHRADYFLRKPVSFSEFNRAIYNLVTY